MAIGTLLGGLASFLTAILAISNRKRIFDWFRTISSLREERDQALADAAEAHQYALSVERRAQQWESTANGAERDLKRIEARIEELESQRGALDGLTEKFEAMVEFTERVIEYAAYLEAKLVAAGIGLERKMPPMPQVLSDRLKGERA